MSIATNNKVMFSEQSVFGGISGDCHPSRGGEGKGGGMLNSHAPCGGGGCSPPALLHCWHGWYLLPRP